MTETMDFLTLAKERFSVRKFSERVVEQDVLDKILQAGYLAPTACNRQPQRILVINSEESIAKLKMCTECHFNTKTALLVCYDKTECWNRKYDGKNSGDIDASIVTTHMMLEAASLGVGSTWVMYFIPEAIITEFELPETYEPVAILVMGYPADDVKPAPAHCEYKPMEQLVSINSFHK